MEQGTIVRRIEQHRDRWSVYGAEAGIRDMSSYLTAGELKQYDVFQDFKDQLLETISPDVSVAVWKKGAVLFEAGSYVDLAFFLVEGTVAAALGAETDRVAERATVEAPRHPDAQAETVFLSAMDFDLDAESEVVELGPGEWFGEIGALNGWPQSVTVKTLSECRVVQIRVPALRLMKRQSGGFRQRINTVYRRRALLPQLRACTLFRGCPQPVLAELAERVELVSCKPGDTVMEEGAPVEALHLVRSGFMRVSQRVGQGTAAVSYLSKGMTFGEIELLIEELDGARFSVASVGYGELVTIARDDLRHVFQRHPGVEETLWGQAVARIKETGSTRRDPAQSVLLEFALDKGLVEGNSILVMDLDVCTRCDDCVRACADTHGGRPRFVREGDRYGHLLIAKSCYHCQDPVCLIGCPTGAIRRANVGDVVEIKEEICIGCGACHQNCPYDAIVMHDTGETWSDDALPRSLRGSPRAVASKCDLCYTSPAGPACVRNCPHHCAFRVGSTDELQALQKRRRS